MKKNADYSIDITPETVSKEQYDKFEKIYNEMGTDWKKTLTTPFNLLVIASVILVICVFLWWLL